MSYTAKTTPEFEADFRRIHALSPVAASAIVEHIERLEQQPAALSRRSHFPYLPNQQLYGFEFETEGDKYRAVIGFQYDADEIHIHLLRLKTHPRIE